MKKDIISFLKQTQINMNTETWSTFPHSGVGCKNHQKWHTQKTCNKTLTLKPAHDKTKTMTCEHSEDSDQPRHPSSQSDQSLCCPHEEALGSWLSLERTTKALIWVFAGRTGHCSGFVMRRLTYVSSLMGRVKIDISNLILWGIYIISYFRKHPQSQTFFLSFILSFFKLVYLS